MQYNTMQYNKIQYNTIQCNTIWYNRLHYRTNQEDISSTQTGRRIRLGYLIGRACDQSRRRVCAPAVSRDQPTPFLDLILTRDFWERFGGYIAHPFLVRFEKFKKNYVHFGLCNAWTNFCENRAQMKRGTSMGSSFSYVNGDVLCTFQQLGCYSSSNFGPIWKI